MSDSTRFPIADDATILGDYNAEGQEILVRWKDERSHTDGDFTLIGGRISGTGRDGVTQILIDSPSKVRDDSHDHIRTLAIDILGMTFDGAAHLGTAFKGWISKVGYYSPEFYDKDANGTLTPEDFGPRYAEWIEECHYHDDCNGEHLMYAPYMPKTNHECLLAAEILVRPIVRWGLRDDRTGDIISTGFEYPDAKGDDLTIVRSVGGGEWL
ncbi:hypothetical protein [Aeromicrobium sp. 179-A 4D2 NHS]|uniref:hypothetical protein n=1 Tax=Aeromicrobium sp. 179-A 4D2 NHS TaxID=3142375 RepID=UPI0039A1B582